MNDLTQLAMWNEWQKKVAAAGMNFAANTIYVEQNSPTEQEFLVVAGSIKDLKLDPVAQLRDAKYGARVVDIPWVGPTTRMWLDSQVEIDFLRRNLPDLSVVRCLDIGAGYGRLAVELAPLCKSVTTIDAVPISVRLCKFYCDLYASSVRVLGIDSYLAQRESLVGTIDLGINIHSFNECSIAQISAWLKELDDLRVPLLFTVSHGQLDARVQKAYYSWEKGQPSWRPLLEEKYTLLAEESIGLGSHPHALWMRKK